MFKILNNLRSFFNDIRYLNLYKTIKILNRKITFFIPNNLINWRVNTFFTKEPETLEWINSFKNKDKFIFWDIGANIGLYSIYNALKNKNSITIAFEPSTSNLRVLSRNVSINNLENKIRIFPIPLTNKKNCFQTMNEKKFVEGGALNAFGTDINFEGKKFSSKMKYKIFGTTINYLIESKILKIPDYIKIDVDGIEHLILEGSNKYLNNKKIKSISIEINENFVEQHKNVLLIMKKSKFKILHKKKGNSETLKNTRFANTYNYVFIR